MTLTHLFWFFCIILMRVHTADAYEDGPVPLHRYWNPKIGDHFYTTNFNELGAGKNGWKYEGVQCLIFKNKIVGTAALYRYWNGRDHFYTRSASEIGTTVVGVRGNHGYVSEGVAGYCYPNQMPGTVALRRYYRSSVVDHFYTTNVNEIGTKRPGQVGKHNYSDEGVACFVYPTPTDA